MRTSITISDETGRLAQQIAKRDFRENFSFVCELALKAYCEPRVTDPVEAELIAAGKELGADNALKLLSRELVRRTRKGARRAA